MSSKSNKTKIDTEFWDKRRGKIRSRKGGLIIGKGVFSHGYNMMEDLLGRVSYMQVVILNATGKLVERKLADWMEGRFICVSIPDPRIWCNHMGALCGTMRTSVIAATTAGILSSDSKAYGGNQTTAMGMRFIQNALIKYKAGMGVEEIIDLESKTFKGRPRIMGYVRPISIGDERVPYMEKITEDLGFKIGEHLELAYKIEQVLIEKYGEGMNLNGYGSAFLSDQGFTPKEVYRISSICVGSGVTACYLNEIENAQEAFLPMKCEDIDYRGKPLRDVPY